jgi:hypothetical protein
MDIKPSFAICCQKSKENLKSLDRSNEDVKEPKEPHYDGDKEQQLEEE